MLKNAMTVLAAVGAIGILGAFVMLLPLLMAMGGMSLGIIECLLPLIAAAVTIMVLRAIKARRIEA